MPECRPPDQSYQLLINWDEIDVDCSAGSTGFDVGNFENDTDCDAVTCVCDTWCEDETQCWYGASDAGPSPSLSRDISRAHTGVASLRIDWETGATTPRVELRWSMQWEIGRSYRVAAWVWVPAGVSSVYFYIDHAAATGTASTSNDLWQKIYVDFTATALGGAGDVQLRASGAVLTGDSVYLDAAVVYRRDEDIWGDLRFGTATTVEGGRDQSRELSPVKVGRLRTTLDASPEVTCVNGREVTTLSKYFPSNVNSSLYGEIAPSCPIKFDVDLDDVTYTLFRGFLDEYTPVPTRLSSTVQISANDLLGLLDKKRVSTELFLGITTGQAINAVLDFIGWPTRQRDVDYGAGILPYFWAESENALSVLIDLVNSEGPPAIMYVDDFGRFVFRDRSHRLLRPRSLGSQMTITDGELSPRYSLPMEYDYGWRDIVNDATYSVDVRVTGVAETTVWTSGDTTHAIIDTLDVEITSSDPFRSAITPVAGTDYTVITGSVSVALVDINGTPKTSGSSLILRITATASPASITDLQLRATPITVSHTINRSLRDTTSSDVYGVKTDTTSRPWLSSWDAVDVVSNIITKHSQPLEMLSIPLAGYDQTTLHRQLGSKLSDRIRVRDSITGLDNLFYIEQIAHTVENTDQDRHTTALGVERISDVALGECFILDESLLDDDVLCVGFTGSYGLGAGTSEDADVVFMLAEDSSPLTGAPLLREYQQTSSWHTNEAAKSVQMTTRSGDVLVVVATTADGTTTLGTPVGNALTYTLEQSSVAAGDPAIYVWSATDTLGGNSWPLSISRTAGMGAWGYGVYVVTRTTGVGASALTGPAVGAPGVSLATTVNQSAVVVISVDDLATNQADRLWRTVEDVVRPTLASNTEKLAQVGSYAVYSAYYHNVGALGAKTYGLVLPTAQRYTIAAIEIKGSIVYGPDPCSVEVTERPLNCLGSRSVLDSYVLGS